MSPVGDEQALPGTFRSLEGSARKMQGAYFTPAWLVGEVLEAVEPLLPDGAFNLVDPACGAGAFLEPAAARWPRARLFGLELSDDVAGFCATRIPSARVLRADALRGGVERLKLPGGFTVFVGNPPYNGTSPLLTDAEWYPKLRALLPDALPAGTSLRDDFAFFLLKAASMLRERAGAIAFVTPSSLLDAFLYSPLRRALLEQLSLTQVVELGAGVFDDAKVKTAFTIWSTQSKVKARYRTRGGAQVPLAPRAPDFLLRPPDARAQELEDAWRASGENLLSLVPVSFPGLKTRFDELLVSEDPRELFERVRDFLKSDVDSFAKRWALEDKLDKLRALKQFVPEGTRAERSRIRPFFRYSGAKHRYEIPASARAHCYLDRRLIPRGDHRFRGNYDPHACEVKLVFNTRELPLASAVVDTPGCVHAHRHARFAPLFVPQRVREEGIEIARSTDEHGELVPNLSPRGLEWAKRMGSPEAVFRAICAFINSDEVQNVWAPTFGASRDLHVPLAVPLGTTAARRP